MNVRNFLESPGQLETAHGENEEVYVILEGEGVMTVY
jgi:mannose-6-phosphate isomerase-like protein (cupin superfamily)